MKSSDDSVQAYFPSRMHLALGFLLLLPICAVPVASEDQAKPDEGPSMRLVSARWVRSRSYIEVPERSPVENARLDLHLDIQFGRERPVGWGHLRIEEIRDDQGRQIELTPSSAKTLGTARLPFEGHGISPHPAGFSLRLSTAPPSTSARVLRRVALSLELIYGFDPRETVLGLEPASLGSWIPLTDLKEAQARVLRLRGHRLDVQVQGIDRLIEVDVLDAQRQPIPPFSRSRMGFAGERIYRLVFRGNLPAGASLRLRHTTREETRSVRLDLSDVPLP